MKWILTALTMMFCITSGAKVQEIKTLKQFEKLMKKPGPRVVLFSADWCAPCQRFHPLYEQLSSKMNIPFYSVNIENPELAQYVSNARVYNIPWMYEANSEESFWINPCHAMLYEFSVANAEAGILQCIMEAK
jgi:thiol-disulfide isomerase/thioredoxin